ncbi:MAG: hypothetical protein LBR10_10795 [Prevotellaceae bacterium]|jgi:hypothetical protein|nr:hypothetical protein [Prevotellaceae bacterium]
MARLKSEVVKKLKKTPEYRMKLALSMNLSEYGVMYNLNKNNDNNSLTKIDALQCIKELLKFDTIEQLLEK